MIHVPYEQKRISSHSNTGCLLFQKCSNSQYQKITRNHRLFIRRTFMVLGPSVDWIHEICLWHPWELIVQSLSEHVLWELTWLLYILFCCPIGKKPFLILNRNLSPCDKSAFSVPDACWRTEDRVRPLNCSSYNVVTSPSKSQILCSSEVWSTQCSQPHSG